VLVVHERGVDQTQGRLMVSESASRTTAHGASLTASDARADEEGSTVGELSEISPHVTHFLRSTNKCGIHLARQHHLLTLLDYVRSWKTDVVEGMMLAKDRD